MLELSECRKWHLAACVCEEAHSIVHICGKLYEDHAGLTQTHIHTHHKSREQVKKIFTHWKQTLVKNDRPGEIRYQQTQHFPVCCKDLLSHSKNMPNMSPLTTAVVTLVCEKEPM